MFRDVVSLFGSSLVMLSLDAARRLMAMRLWGYKVDMCYNSALVMFWTYYSTLSVGSLARLAS